MASKNKYSALTKDGRNNVVAFQCDDYKGKFSKSKDRRFLSFDECDLDLSVVAYPINRFSGMYNHNKTRLNGKNNIGFETCSNENMYLDILSELRNHGILVPILKSARSQSKQSFIEKGDAYSYIIVDPGYVWAAHIGISVETNKLRGNVIYPTVSYSIIFDSGSPRHQKIPKIFMCGSKSKDTYLLGVMSSNGGDGVCAINVQSYNGHSGQSISDLAPDIKKIASAILRSASPIIGSDSFDVGSMVDEFIMDISV